MPRSPAKGDLPGNAPDERMLPRARGREGDRRAQGAGEAGRRAGALRERQLRPMALRFPLHPRPCRRAGLSRQADRRAPAPGAGRLLRAEAEALTGVAGNFCVLFTAHDAYMRDFRLIVPRDCVASQSEADDRYSLEHMASVTRADTRPAAQIDLAALALS